MAAEAEQPTLVPVVKPISLIPVGLKEAALDSPSFRATTVHFSEQIESLERWLESYVKSASKLVSEVSELEGEVNSFLQGSEAPLHLSEATLDHDYTMLAIQRCAEGARDFWAHIIGGLKRTQRSVVHPIRAFLQNEIRPFKDTRRQLESTQRSLDAALSRYFSQPKTKEPSALREDAFQLHEARKAYLKASMDFCVFAPQLRANLDALLINVFSNQWLEMKSFRESTTTAFARHGLEVDRIRSWSSELTQGENVLKKELLLARKEIEESAEVAIRPSRELDDYAASTVPFLGARGPSSNSKPEAGNPSSSKQGWLFLRTLTGKPSRTTWIRRWFFVKNGIFGWLVQGSKTGGVEESEKVGVLLCNVRPALQEERRFCFEVKTKDTSVILQAETQADLVEWMSVFDAAKQKALDERTPTEVGTSSGNPSSDAAFAVSPAIAPELAAKQADGHIANIADQVPDGLQVPEGDGLGDQLFRASTDIATLRRATGESERERSRDHAVRIIQKLDLHRKSTVSPQLSPVPSQIASSTNGGIASLMSASHSALPVRAATVSPGPKQPTFPESATGTLAPSTLVSPPQATNLTKTAVMIGFERGYDLGVVDSTGGVPSSLMANQWGSTNYGHISRVERGEIRPALERFPSLSSPRHDRRLSDPPAVAGDSSLSNNRPGSGRTSSPPKVASPLPLMHRKTLSEVEDKIQLRRKAVNESMDVPPYYPHNLRLHDAQLRMLFPNVDPRDRVVMVFRASWSPGGQNDLPGRIYVTMNDMFYYSQQHGLTLVSGIGLSTIMDVTAVPGSEHDFIVLQISPRRKDDEPVTAAIKTFIEPIKALQRRLSFLVSNCQSEEPAGLEAVLKTLILLEKEPQDFSPSPDSWRGGSPARSFIDKQLYKQSIKVDRSLYGDALPAIEDHDVNRFRLPGQPVLYSPRGMTDRAAERVFDTSAKALFHICFGDRSLISQMLYRERGAQTIKQSPWTKSPDGTRSRRFEYTVAVRNTIGLPKSYHIIDSQIIDVANDHLCYVVTDMKIPWHLPRSQDFCLVMKAVITHVAKSKAKLAIFTKTEWFKGSSVYRRFVDRPALDDLNLDALDFVDLVSEQVEKLGPSCDTKKAVEVFGHLGHHTDVAQINTDQSVFGRKVRLKIRQRTLPGLALDALGIYACSAASTLIGSLLGFIKSILTMFTTHTILTTLLLLSMSTHIWHSTELASNWWQERRTANFMHRVGVRPDTVMSKSISLVDLDDAISSLLNPTSHNFSSMAEGDHSSKCLVAFRSLLSDNEAHHHEGPPAQDEIEYTESSARSIAYRLRRTRERMGIYRHELLVAMRFVNRVEQETLQSEYEAWLFDENVKCHRMQQMLRAGLNHLRGDENNSTDSQDIENGKRDLKRRYLSHAQVSIGEYCNSCHLEQQALALRGVM